MAILRGPLLFFREVFDFTKKHIHILHKYEKKERSAPDTDQEFYQPQPQSFAMFALV